MCNRKQKAGGRGLEYNIWVQIIASVHNNDQDCRMQECLIIFLSGLWDDFLTDSQLHVMQWSNI